MFPIRLRTKKRIQEFGFGHVLAGVDVIQPLDYLKLMGLVMHSAFVITDSGGLQKEAYLCGKRALVVMPDTGWRELVDIGWNVLVYKGFSCSMTSEDLFGVYGKGDASCRIVQVLTQCHETNYAIGDVTLDED
ncbi:MAG TPA: UDP-N-acetyl glucosamine 2-epimerase [Clostridiales bacterium]|nr:UDP-N-acetyl glucosamine 2-epimerase [Clostridiales bacterium]